MDGIEKLFDPQTPAARVEVCKAVVRKGLDVGRTLGEKLNEWIDDLFDLITD